jgi:branched-chain amino acid transport system ATP-binding protein
MRLILRMEQVSSGYTGSEILHGISIKALQGKVTVLIGPNGAGKTTLLSTIVGLVRASSGKIYYDSRKITSAKTSDIVGMGISYVPQGASVFPRMTVRENLEMGGYLLSSSEEVRTKINEVAAVFPVLRERLKQKAGLLSGGERQMLSIARGLMLSPSLLLLDEPSMGLDIGKQEIIFNKLADLNKKGLGILLVEQYVKHAYKIADYVYVLNGGTIRYAGEPSLLLDKKRLTEMFFGTGSHKEAQTSS